MSRTAFYWDEKCFWHAGNNYAQLAPVRKLVQPMVAGGLPEAPETKRRLKNLMDVTGLSTEIDMLNGAAATTADLTRVHPESYLQKFKALSDELGGELGLRTPFGPGGYDIAALSAGLCKHAVIDVLTAQHTNAYALSRPPGHHCLPDWPNGFCLLNNIAIAIEAAKALSLFNRIAVVDWDVHHGNGTEHIFYDRNDVLTISIHQERCYPQDTGATDARGNGDGAGYNVNIPLSPGCGHNSYLYAMDNLIIPTLDSYNPDLVIVACGFDASGYDPLSRMMCSVETFRLMTRKLMQLTDNKLVVVHEGGYSEMYVPFCGHAVVEELSGSRTTAGDPMQARINGQQPNSRVDAFHQSLIDEMVDKFLSAV